MNDAQTTGPVRPLITPGNTRRDALLLLADDIQFGRLAMDLPDAGTSRAAYAALIRRTAREYPVEDPTPLELITGETALSDVEIRSRALHAAALYHSADNGGPARAIIEDARTFEAYLRGEVTP